MRESNRLSVKKIEAALSAKAIARAKKVRILRDGNGLLLRIEPNGAARWVLRITVKGRRCDIGLGSARDISLSGAREAAAKSHSEANQGGDPVAKRRADRQGVITFGKAAEEVHQQRQETWANKKHQNQWITTLRTYAFPRIGKIPVGDVASADVLKVLLPIWLTKPETARRVRQRIRTVLEWAVAMEHRSESLANAADACKPGLQRQPKRDSHHAAVPWQEIPCFTAAVRESRSGEAVRLALEFLLLTASRTGEVLGAKWEEFDLDAATWMIPASRMKAQRKHRVPLSKPVLQILRECRARWPQSAYVFPGRHLRAPLSNMAMLMLMRRGLKREEVPHGLRSSFRDWCADNRKDRDLAEAALAHALPNKTEAAYQRSDLFEARRGLMEGWAEFVCQLPAADSASEARAGPKVPDAVATTPIHATA